MNRVVVATELRAIVEPLPDIASEPLMQRGGSGRTGFSIANRELLLTGTPAHGLRSVWLQHRHVVRDFRITDLVCSALLESPLGVQRDLHAGNAHLRERTMAAPNAPAVIVEWTATDDVAFSMQWTYTAGDDTAFFLSRHADITTVQAGHDISAHVHVVLRAGESLGLLITNAATNLDALEPATWARVHAAATERRRRELVTIDACEPEVARRWEWAKYALASEAVRPQLSLNVARALLAVGEFDVVRAVLNHEHWAPRERAILLAEYHAAVGDNPAHELPADDIRVCPEWQPPEDATSFVLSFMHHVIGYLPDGARGRLTVRPTIPHSWRALTVANIRIADASIHLQYEATDRGHRFTLRQTAGAYPIRLIFEPRLPAAPKHAFVDGNLASLDLYPAGSRTAAPVQIMLDDQRVVDFEMP